MKALLLDPCMFNTAKVRDACIPSANGHFSARALGKFYAALASDGIVDQTRVLARGRVAEMAAVQGQAPGRGGMPSVDWARGVRKFCVFTADGKERDDVFGHAGIGGALAFSDPTAELAVAITVNKLTIDGAVPKEIANLIYSELRLGQLIDL